jgi:hypothetical protein
VDNLDTVDVGTAFKCGGMKPLGEGEGGGLGMDVRIIFKWNLEKWGRWCGAE